MKPSGSDRISLAEADSVLRSLWEEDAAAWDKYWVPIFSPFARKLVMIASAPSGGVVLDAGTGSGLAVHELCKTIPSVSLVVGIDSSEAMIRLARRRAASAGMKSAKFFQMLAEDLRFPDGFFDVVVSNCGLSVAGFSQCVSEVFRVLRPGGAFVFNDWHLIDVKPHRVFGEILGKHRTSTPSSQLARERAALAATERYHRSLDARAQLQILREKGFKKISLVRHTHRVRLRSVGDFLRIRLCRATIRREMSEMSTSSRRVFLSDLRSALRQFVREGAFVLDWDVFYIRAAKPR